MGLLTFFGKPKGRSHALVIGDLRLLDIQDISSHQEDPVSTPSTPPPGLSKKRSPSLNLSAILLRSGSFTRKGGNSPNNSSINSPTAAGLQRRMSNSLPEWLNLKTSGLSSEAAATATASATSSGQDSTSRIQSTMNKTFRDQFNFNHVSFHTAENALTKEKTLAKIKSLFKSTQASIVLLYYVGDADECGNWKIGSNNSTVGMGNLIAFRELSMLWQKNRKHSQHLILILDSPNAGCWVQSLQALSRAEQLELCICIQAANSPPPPTPSSPGAATSQYIPGTFTPLFMKNNLRQITNSKISWPTASTRCYHSTWMCSSLQHFGLPLFFFDAHMPAAEGMTSRPVFLDRKSDQSHHHHHHHQEIATYRESYEYPSGEGLCAEDPTSSSVFWSPRHDPMTISCNDQCQTEFSRKEVHSDPPRGFTDASQASSEFNQELLSLLRHEKSKQQRRGRAMDGEQNLEDLLDDETRMGGDSVMSSFISIAPKIPEGEESPRCSSILDDSMIHTTPFGNATPGPVVHNERASMLGARSRLGSTLLDQDHGSDKGSGNFLSPRLELTHRLSGTKDNRMLRHILTNHKAGHGGAQLDSEPPSPAASVILAGRGGRGRLEIGGSETSSKLFNDDEERFRMLREIQEMNDSRE